jgi:aspartate carbamoyltransferase catalytic subunit
MNKHLLSINDLSREEIESILATARIDFFELSKRDIKKVPTLRGRTIIDIFYEKSTRTSTSFELAGKRLSADVINVKADSSSVGKGESLKDTVLTLSAYRPDIIVIRHPHVGAAAFVARCVDTGLNGGSAFGIKGRGAHVINAGDGKGEHPTQCLLDIFSLQQVYGELDGLKVAIVGDILHSRVARSDIHALTTLGVPEVRAIGPETLLPKHLDKLGVHVFHNMEEGLKDCDVVIMLRLQRERMQTALLPSEREFFKLYGLTEERLQLAKPDAIVMHPGPINRGVEIDSRVADGLQSVILEQVTNGIAVRMAVMSMIMGPQAGGVA